MEKRRGSCWLRASAVLAFWLTVSPALSAAVELPPGIAKGLAADDFATRERSQTELADWVRRDPQGTVPAALAAWKASGDPEFRVRVMAALRSVADGEYARHGQGFIGVTMIDETVTIPDRADAVPAIRVVQVMEGSPAAGKLAVEDMIVSLNGRFWTEGAATTGFSREIKETRPGTEVGLGVLREGRLRELKLRLGKRPEDLEQRMFPGGADPAEAIRRSKDAFFKRWLRDMGGKLR